MNGLTIGKVAKGAGLGIETVRFYEREGLIEPPARTEANYRIYPKRGGVPSTALWPTSSFAGAFPVNLYLHWRTNKIAFAPRLRPTNVQIHASLRGKGSTNDTGGLKHDIVVMYIM